MTDLRQAAQQALEALDGALWLMLDKPVDEQYRVRYAYLLSVITALREALEQQAEPCVGKDPRCPCQDGDACHYKDCGGTKAWPVPVAQPEQKPVAYDKTEINGFVQELYDKKMQEGKHGHYETMFHVVHQAIKRVSPPAAQRPWVGLTEFQFAEIYNKWNDTNGSTAWGLNQALEAKLRKLNK